MKDKTKESPDYYDSRGRYRNKIIAFRVSPEEAKLIEVAASVTGHYPFRLHDVSFRLSVQPRSLINKITGGLFGVKTRVSIAKTMKNRAK